MIATLAQQFSLFAALTPRLEHRQLDVELIFEGRVDPDHGEVIAESEIDGLWQPIDAMLNRKVLSEIPGLEIPSTEHIAGWIFANIARNTRAYDLALRELLKVVRVRDSSATWCAVWRADLEMSDIERFVRLTH